MPRDSNYTRFARLNARLAEELRLGATGKYPDGKIHRTDEGAIRLAVFVEHGNVVLNFGTPVSWIVFDAQKAEELAGIILEKAKEARQ